MKGNSLEVSLQSYSFIDKLMEKEENKSKSQNEDQEELSNLEFGFVYDFFISKGKSGASGKQTIKEQTKDKNESKFQDSDQSVAFFLPDFFTHDD
jgi:hypothetical protein